MTELDDDFAMWRARQPTAPGQFGLRGAVLKKGPRVCKTVALADYGDPVTGELRKRELSFLTAERHAIEPGYDFDNPRIRWACENEEVERLLAFLHSDVAETGRYRVVDTASPIGAILELLSAGSVDARTLATALVNRGDLAEVIDALATTDTVRSAAEGAMLTERRQLVESLQQLAADPAATTETAMQAVMGDAYWLFGGRYVGVADRRNLVPLDQHDIPLLGADGTLHIVEMKGPHIPRLIRRHRNHWIVGNDVHEAVSQAMSYLRALDEQGATLETMYRNEFGVSYDMRRVFATVVIGHPAHVSGADERTVQQTLRSYNAHLSRIEVVTYKGLLDAAERALAFEQTAHEGQADHAGQGGSGAPAAALGAQPADDLWDEPADDPWGEPPF
jgi:hypothetical protein